MIVIVPKIGVATALVSVMIGQIVMSTIIDHFGLFGGKQIPFDTKRLLALILLVVALFLFFKKD